MILFQLLKLSTVALTATTISRGPCLWPGYPTGNNHNRKMAGICAIARVPLEYEPRCLELYHSYGQHYFLSSSGGWWGSGLLKIPAVCTRFPWGLFTWYKNSSLLWSLKIRYSVQNSPDWSNPKPAKSSIHILTLCPWGRRHFDNRRWNCSLLLYGSHRAGGLFSLRKLLLFPVTTGRFREILLHVLLLWRRGVFYKRNSERFLLLCQWKKNNSVGLTE
jgi:hypothetical protein